MARTCRKSGIGNGATPHEWQREPDCLTQAEAQKRLNQYGPNAIEEKKTNLFLKFLTYFRNPIPWMIEVAVLGTQIVATLIAVYGLFMTPLGWGWALVWFLLNDRLKLLAYRIVNPVAPRSPAA